MQVRTLVKRIWAWIKPMSRWRDRVIGYRAGVTVWAVEGRPDMDAFFPWPPEWCIWKPSAPPGTDVKAVPVFSGCTSLISGQEANGDDAVRCARCGIHLHASEAGMTSNVDIPACSWCVGAVRRAR